jgi:hypothetical protein
VPQALIDLGYPRKEEKKSLKTDDPGIAETLWTKQNTVVEAKWDQWRRGLQVLTPRKREALAGEIYQRVLRENQFPYFCGGIGTALKLGVPRRCRRSSRQLSPGASKRWRSGEPPSRTGLARIQRCCCCLPKHGRANRANL